MSRPFESQIKNPLLRVQYRPDQARGTARWTFTRIERWATPLLIVAVVTWFGLPTDLMSFTGYLAPVSFGAALALLFEIARRLNSIPAAALILLFAGAYMLGVGDASVEGMLIAEIYASPTSVWLALISVVTFLAVLTLGSGFFKWGFRRLIPTGVWNDPQDRPRSLLSRGLAVITIASFGVSLAVGSWSTYGAVGTETDRTGGLRWELLCEPAVLSGIAILIDEIVRIAERRQNARRFLPYTILLGLLGLILFVRQVRRIMLAAVLMSFLQVSWNETAARRWFSSTRRLLTMGALMLALIGAFYVGSIAWRQSAASFATNDLSARVADAASRVGEFDDSNIEGTKARLNYLWLESASVEYQPVLTRGMSLADMFVRWVYLSVPGSLVPAKYSYELVTCETAFFSGLHLDTDLACTPSAEGYIALGFLGVVLVALAWAPILGLAAFLMERRTALGLIIAMHLLDPLVTIETSAFPIVFSLRQAAVGVFFIGLASALGVVFFGWGAFMPQRGRSHAT